MKRIIALAIPIIFLFSSCIELEEVIWLNKKGGGTYEFIINAADFMDAISQFAGEEALESEQMKQTDSVIYLADEITPGMLDSFPCLANVQEVKIHIKNSLEDEEASIRISIPFQKLAEMDKNFECLAQAAAKDPRVAGMPGPSDNPLATKFMHIFTQGKKSLTRNSVAYFKKPFMDWLDDQGESEESENVDAAGGIIAMILANMDFKTTIHVPKKVKKIEFAGAYSRPDDRTITFENDLEGLMGAEKLEPFSITYK